MTNSISLAYFVKAGEVAAFIREKCREGGHGNLSFAVLTRKFAICETSLKQAFKRRYRCTVHAYVIAERIEYVRELLETTSQSVSAVAAIAGYRELSNFSRDFRKTMGVSPAEFRRGLVLSGVEELIS